MTNATTAPALFDLEPLPAATPRALTTCVYCLGKSPHRITHRLVWAVNLMCPRWWENGSRPDGSLSSYYGGRVQLWGAYGGVCAAHANHPVRELPGDFKIGHIALIPLGEASR